MNEDKGSGTLLFKSYNQRQQMLLPPDLDDLIPQEHLVRVVNDTIDKILLESLKRRRRKNAWSASAPCGCGPPATAGTKRGHHSG